MEKLKKEYWIKYRKGDKLGAFTFSEIINLDIYDDTEIWKAGWDDWKVATQVEELKEYIIATPPITKEEKNQLQKKENLTLFIDNFKNYFPKFFIVFIVSTLIWTFYMYEFSKNGGSYANPIYLSKEERLNPSLIFWNLLPYNALIIGFIMLFILVLYSYFKKPANDNEKIVEHDLVEEQELAPPLKEARFVFLFKTYWLSFIPIINILVLPTASCKVLERIIEKDKIHAMHKIKILGIIISGTSGILFFTLLSFILISGILISNIIFLMLFILFFQFFTGVLIFSNKSLLSIIGG